MDLDDCISRFNIDSVVILIKAFIFFILLGFAFQANSQISVVDDGEHVLFFKEPPKKIISLAPNLTEILFYLNVGDRIVAVDNNSDFPVAVKKIPIVATYGKINLEALLRLQPDLVFVEDRIAITSQLLQLQKLGIRVYVCRTHHLKDITRVMTNLAIIMGKNEIIDTKIKQFETEISSIKNHYQSLPPVQVFYELWHKPLLTVNHSTMINEMIEVCGGRNIFSSLKTSSAQISLESILQKNPDLIIASQSSDWRKWPHLKAVRNNAIYIIPADWAQRPGPRVLLALKKLCECIHPSNPAAWGST